MSDGGMAMMVLSKRALLWRLKLPQYDTEMIILCTYITLYMFSLVQTLARINPHNTPVGKISIITYACDSAGNNHRWATTDWLLL